MGIPKNGQPRRSEPPPMPGGPALQFVRPTPMSITTWGQSADQSPAGVALIWTRLETVLGTIAYPMDLDMAKEIRKNLDDAIRETESGLTIAQPGDVPDL